MVRPVRLRPGPGWTERPVRRPGTDRWDPVVREDTKISLLIFRYAFSVIRTVVVYWFGFSSTCSECETGEILDASTWLPALSSGVDGRRGHIDRRLGHPSSPGSGHSAGVPTAVPGFVDSHGDPRECRYGGPRGHRSVGEGSGRTLGDDW